MVKIYWEIILSFAGFVAGFLVAEFMLEKIGLGLKTQKTKINFDDLPEFLNSKFLVNCAILIGEKESFSSLDDQEIEEMKKMLNEANCNEIAILKEDICKLAIRKGRVFVCVRGKLFSMKELAEISEVIHRSLRGVAE